MDRFSGSEWGQVAPPGIYATEPVRGWALVLSQSPQPGAGPGARGYLPVLRVLSFLDAPVTYRYLIGALGGDVAVFRAQLSGATRTPASDIVLTIKGRVVQDAQTLRECGAEDGTEVVATRRVRSGSSPTAAGSGADGEEAPEGGSGSGPRGQGRARDGGRGVGRAGVAKAGGPAAAEEA